jgi:tetratricopeptide (TPR) repeat protein
MTLALARPEVHPLFPNLWTERSFTELRLPPLTKKASTRLVREALADAATDELVQRVVERAEGNPFFLEELIRAVASGKGDELPSTVLAMVQARLEALHVEERRVLRAASVFGKAFSSAGVMALLGGDDGPTLATDWFAELVKKEVLSRPAEVRFGGEFTFNHALVREAAYSMLTATDRTLGHRLAAEWLEREGAAEPVVLAEHFERGGEGTRAIAWYKRGAEQALEGNDFSGAIRWALRAIEMGAPSVAEGALRLIECEARRWRGENELAEAAAIQAMRRLPRGSAAWCDAATELATAAGALGHIEQVVALASELETAAEQDTHSQLVMALARVARPLFWTGRHALGSRVLLRAVALAERAGTIRPTALAALAMARGLEARVLGDPSECLKWNEAAVAESERAGDLRLGCLQRTNLGYSYLEIGANEEAERTLLEVLATSERLNLTRIRVSAGQNLGVALFRRGDLEEAARLERTAVEVFEAQGDVRMTGGSLVYLALVQVALGDLDGARRSAARAVEMLGAIPPMRCSALAALASIEVLRGDLTVGVAMATEAHDLLAMLGGGIEEGESAVRLAYAEALHAAGDAAGARTAILAARDRLHERAGKIKDPRWRETFVTGIPENVRTMALAALWAG